MVTAMFDAVCGKPHSEGDDPILTAQFLSCAIKVTEVAGLKLSATETPSFILHLAAVVLVVLKLFYEEGDHQKITRERFGNVITLEQWLNTIEEQAVLKEISRVRCADHDHGYGGHHFVDGDHC